MGERKPDLRKVSVENLPTIYPLTVEIVEKADQAANRAAQRMRGMDISKLTIAKIVDLISPCYEE